MDTLEAIKTRRSTRKFISKQVPQDILDQIIEAGMAAPVGSAMYDKMHITVVQNQEVLNQIGNDATSLMLEMLGKKLNKNFQERELHLRVEFRERDLVWR